MVQTFLKKWWVESDFKAPNLPLSLRLKVYGCHYNSIYNNTWTKQAKLLSKQHQTQWSKCLMGPNLSSWWSDEPKPLFLIQWWAQTSLLGEVMSPNLSSWWGDEPKPLFLVRWWAQTSLLCEVMSPNLSSWWSDEPKPLFLVRWWAQTYLLDQVMNVM